MRSIGFMFNKKTALLLLPIACLSLVSCSHDKEEESNVSDYKVVLSNDLNVGMYIMPSTSEKNTYYNLNNSYNQKLLVDLFNVMIADKTFDETTDLAMSGALFNFQDTYIVYFSSSEANFCWTIANSTFYLSNLFDNNTGLNVPNYSYSLDDVDQSEIVIDILSYIAYVTDGVFFTPDATFLPYRFLF